MNKTPENSFHPKTRDQWRAWLEKHHERQTGVWLITYKATTGKPRVSYDEAVEEALCFGWIDSKSAKLDDERSMLWFAPRKAGSGWSRINKERIEKLMASGAMAPAGLSKIEAAKADGSWNKLDDVDALKIPDDLQKALKDFEDAETNFAAFPSSVRRGILEWISAAKNPETRAKRVDETARLAAQNVRANQWRKK